MTLVKKIHNVERLQVSGYYAQAYADNEVVMNTKKYTRDNLRMYADSL